MVRGSSWVMCPQGKCLIPVLPLLAILKSPDCELQILGLCKEAFDKEAQKQLKDVEVRNPLLLVK